MDTFARIVVYSAVGLILLLLNVVYVVRVAAEWRKGPATPIVPPLGLIGKADASPPSMPSASPRRLPAAARRPCGPSA